MLFKSCIPISGHREVRKASSKNYGGPTVIQMRPLEREGCGGCKHPEKGSLRAEVLVQTPTLVMSVISGRDFRGDPVPALGN
jgi:hypothetical protein